MGSRFGRNQRRAARERIASLEERIASLETIAASQERRAVRAEWLVSRAKEDGANEVLRAKYLDQMVRQISDALARSYGPEILDAAQRLIASDVHRRSDFVSISWKNSPVSEVAKYTVLEGKIASLHYRMQVSS